MDQAHGRPGMSPLPAVSIIVPMRNERAHAELFLRSVLAQETPAELEIIVADGMSDDGTRAMLAEMSSRDPRVRVIDNPGRIVSTGLNAAIREARGEIVIRMDAHTEYARDYVERCLAVRRSTEADNVGGAWQARGRTYLQSAIALGFQSRFSSGGARSHRVGYEGEVDSVYLGCWSRAALLQLGLFDEELVRNQDDELNLRLKRGGGRIWQSPQIRSWYYPRASLRALFAQYSQYGYWKVRVIQKHRIPASVRHLVPGLLVMSLIGLGVASLLFPQALRPFAFVALLYATAVIVASVATCRERTKWKYVIVMPLVFATYQLGYGWGFVRGVLDFVVLKKRGRMSFRVLTR
jgi:succinoglycan biosynthesis protein ExoA